MNLMRIVFSYARNSETIDLLYGLFVGVPLFFYGIVSLHDSGLYGLVLPVTMAVVVILVYFLIRRTCATYFINRVKNPLSKVGELLPPSKTSDRGTDAIDLEVLRIIQGVGGNTLHMMSQYSNKPYKEMELLPRMTRLYALGYVTMDKSKLILAAEAQEILNTPSYLLRSHIPPEIARKLDEIRSELNAGNTDGVMNGTNKLFEYSLRERLRSGCRISKRSGMNYASREE